VGKKGGYSAAETEGTEHAGFVTSRLRRKRLGDGVSGGVIIGGKAGSKNRPPKKNPTTGGEQYHIPSPGGEGGGHKALVRLEEERSMDYRKKT